MAMGECLLLAKAERGIGNRGFRIHPRMLQMVLEMEASHLLPDEREEQSFPPSSNSMCSGGSVSYTHLTLPTKRIV